MQTRPEKRAPGGTGSQITVTWAGAKTILPAMFWLAGGIEWKERAIKLHTAKMKLLFEAASQAQNTS